MRQGGKTYIYRQPNPKEIRLDKWARVWVRQGVGNPPENRVSRTLGAAWA